MGRGAHRTTEARWRGVARSPGAPRAPGARRGEKDPPLQPIPITVSPPACQAWGHLFTCDPRAFSSAGRGVGQVDLTYIAGMIL